MTELKPCPCCDYKVDLVESSYRERRWMVYCEGCGLNISEKQGRKLAINQWNTRPIEDALQSQIDRLTKERDEAKQEAQMMRDILVPMFRDDVDFKQYKYSWENKTDD